MQTAFSEILKNSPEYKDLLFSVEKKQLPLGVLGLSAIHKAHFVHALTTHFEKTALVILPDEASAVKLCADLEAFGQTALLYPERSFAFHTETEIRSHEYEQKRLKALTSMLENTVDVVACSISAAMQRTVPPENLKAQAISIHKGQEVSISTLVDTLLQNGYVRADMVEGVGQFSLRGGILDLFSPDAESPIRLEFFGDEVDTMCYFDLRSQRRTENLDIFSLMPSSEILVQSEEALIEKIEALAKSLRGKYAAKQKEALYADIDRLKNGVKLNSADKYMPLCYPQMATILDYLGKDRLFFVGESSNCKERGLAAHKLLSEEIKALYEEGDLCKGLDTFCLTMPEVFKAYDDKGAIYLDNFARGSFDTPVKALLSFTATQSSGWNGQLKVLLEDMEPVRTKGSTIVILAGTEKTAKALQGDLIAQDIPAVYYATMPKAFPKDAVSVLSGTLSYSFSYPHEKFYLFAFGRAALQSKKHHSNARFKKGQGLHSLDDLKKGDYVVHAAHGIGLFDGVQKLEVGKVTKDYLKIRYAKGDVLYVPVTQLDLVSKYIGPHEETGRTVKLNRMGGTDWEKTRSKVRKAVKDMADQLIKLYAERTKVEGYAFSPDIDMQNDFERRFPYDETSDQLRAIDEIKGDMEKPFPMDRLLCGDVGFGKTEVALRAAFKCIADGKQCALLVPTTILALQHYRTVLSRFENFPVNVEMISRFRTAGQQAKILTELKRGNIDFIIGTHRLVSKDVAFRDLGLLIVDEEQRFGVAQKEKLKELFPHVDVLTLSATPIPRTLNMAMTGIRDMSVLEEAPQDRFPVQTYVLEYDMHVLMQAMEKELRRGGQVYFLHNRVETIEQRAQEIRSFLPDAKVAVAHGKMPEERLSDIWRRLLEGDIDILVCTTIIETGVDVPNCNTLIIEDADRLGLAQLHQIRGRVGRSARRASAYFTFKRDKELSEIASHRLSAIREYTEFGSGFKIAMRDLEIRGAGNVLGAQQHGHMEAVGYDMYLQLLEDAVCEEKGQKNTHKQKDCLIDMQIDAHIPESYIEDLSQRLLMYRRIADVRNAEDAADVREELRDRFGSVPPSVNGLIDISLLRNTASQKGIYEVGQKGQTILLYVHEMDTSLVLLLSGCMRGRVSITDFGKKSINVKIAPTQSPLDALREIFGYLTPM